ncbi:TPA: hypothetical protein ACX6PV_003925 [Photobacterium damselae]
MKINSNLSIIYVNNKNEKRTLKSKEINIELNNGQILTISPDRDGNSIIVSDQSCTPNDYAVISIKPGACNLVSITSQKIGKKVTHNNEE